MAKEPIKIMISSSVYGAQSLLRQAYATLLGFGYEVINRGTKRGTLVPKRLDNTV